MQVISALGTSALYSSACYGFTQGCKYLCTRPILEGRVATIFDSVREKCADFKEYLAAKMGERTCSFFSDVVIENAWISVFVVSFLLLSLSAKEVLAITSVLLPITELLVAYSFCRLNIVPLISRIRTFF